MTDITHPVQRPASDYSTPAFGHLLCAETDRHDDRIVVYVRGELDLASSPALVRRLLELMNQQIDTLTLDLAGLEFIDSSALAALNTVHTSAQDRQIAFTLASVPPHARRVLDLTGLTEHFNLESRGLP